MLPSEAGTSITLHDSARRTPVWSGSRDDSNVAATFLHNDAQDDTFIDANRSSSPPNGIEDPSYVVAGISRHRHIWLKDVEQLHPI